MTARGAPLTHPTCADILNCLTILPIWSFAPDRYKPLKSGAEIGGETRCTAHRRAAVDPWHARWGEGVVYTMLTVLLEHLELQQEKAAAKSLLMHLSRPSAIEQLVAAKLLPFPRYATLKT